MKPGYTKPLRSPDGVRMKFRIVFDADGIPSVDTGNSEVCVRLWPTPDPDDDTGIAWVIGPTDCVAHVEEASASMKKLRGRREARLPLRRQAGEGFIAGYVVRDEA